MSKNIIFLFLIAAALSAGVGYYVGRTSGKAKGQEILLSEKQHEIKEIREGGYKFISPLLECQDASPSSRNNMVVLENKLKKYISQIKSEKKAGHISIYFRELNNGPWIGIGENEPYSPASLLKVPIMIAALKKAEKSPGFLEKRITYKSHTTDTTNPNITDSLIRTGSSYTIENLIYRMSAFSDNEAKNLILENLDVETLDNTYLNLGIDVPGLRSPDDFMSVKEYSSFFRVLYNATYLNKNMSEKALEILSKSTFRKGLPAGVPPNITISHKFGERGFADSEVKQLHDCGIVYKEGNPYILCVMTRGSDFEELTKVISGASALVYSEFGDK